MGSRIVKICNSAIDISDGFFGDLSKLIKHNDYGASIVTNCIPFSNKAKHLIKKGYEITVFTRGRLPVPDVVEHIKGDRKSESDLSSLQGRKFDIIIDSSGWTLDDS